jgi:hypothetical protein
MEINELVSYFFNSETNIIEVSFRTINDPDDMIRIDSIDFSIAEDYGFDLIVENFDFFDDELFDEIEENEIKIELDEDELITFLNEYYIVNPESIPSPEIF